MPDPIPEEELLPSRTPVETEPIPAPPPEVGNESVEFAGALFGTGLASIFSRNQFLEEDKKFRKIAEKKVADWQKNNPGLFDDKVFIKRKADGQTVINPEIEKLIPNLRQSSYYKFKASHPDSAARYERLEAKRIYQANPQLDPAVQRLQKNLKQSLPNIVWNQTGPQRPNQELGEEERDKQYREFARKYPEKARYYSHKDPEMKKAYQADMEERWAKMGRGRRAFTRLYDPESVPISQKRAWMPSRMRKVFDGYDARKQAASSRISNRYQKSLLGRGINRTSNAVLRPIEYLQNTTDRAVSFIQTQAMRPVYWAKNTAGRALRSIGSKVFSALAKRMPGLAGIAARGALAVKQLITSGFRGLSRMAGQLLKQGMRFAVRTGARLLATAVAFTMPFWGWIAVGVGIAGGILLIILLIIIITQQVTMDGKVSIDVQKTGPLVTPNPVQDEENLVTYVIEGSYSGPIGSVVVVDTLPPETEYVSSGGPVEPTVNGNVITWNIVTGSGTGTTLTGPSNLDTFNQSYFSSIGFPAPSGTVQLSAEGLQRWDEGAGAAILKAAGIIGIDPGLIGAWSFFEGINYDPAVDNCDDGRNGEDTNPLTRCGNTSNWQVGGVGIRPSEQLGVLAEAFEQMYGSSDASTVQRVGQDVYSKIGRSGTFPSISAAEAASSFSSNPDLAGDLMRDWQIGAYILAKLFKSYGNSVADTMERWSPEYYNRQKYINWVKALYDAR